MDLIFDEVFRALTYLLIAGVVYMAYKLAHEKAMSDGKGRALWSGLLWCAGIALFASFTLGNPTCIDSDQDMYGTHCYQYDNDGFQPSTEQRVASFSYFFVLLYVPVVIGAHKGASSY